MGKKRKADATRLDEADRHLYANFRTAANSLSMLYSQTVNQQRLSFQSGQHHALEKLYQWILRRHEEGLQVTTGEIVAYLQAEIQYDASDDAATPSSTSVDNSNSQTIYQSSGFDAPVSSSISPSSNVGFDQQAKLLNLPDAPPTNPVPQSLNRYHHFSDNSSHHNVLHPHINMQSNNEARDHGQRHSSLDPIHTSDDCSDMQTDDPSHKSAYRFKHE